MNKKILYILAVITMLILLSCRKEVEEPKYDWNNGHCTKCGGELIWTGSSSKEHYTCERCGEEYRFDGVLSKNGRENN